MAVSRKVYGTIALMASITGAIGDFAVTTVLGLLYKDYNAFTDSQSDLGTFNSPVAVYMNTWEVLLGLLFLTCAWSLYRTGLFKSRLEKSALWLLAIYGIGEGIGSGLFAFNHVHHELTATGWVHSIFSGLGITSMVILSFVLVRLYPKKGFRRLHRTLAWCAGIGALFIFLCLLSRKNFLSFVGLWQRLYLVAYYVMLIAWTCHVARESKKRRNEMNLTAQTLFAILFPNRVPSFHMHRC